MRDSKTEGDRKEEIETEQLHARESEEDRYTEGQKAIRGRETMRERVNIFPCLNIVWEGGREHEGVPVPLARHLRVHHQPVDVLLQVEMDWITYL